eukprot:jgi/Chlat1/988/Chrsp108S01404
MEVEGGAAAEAAAVEARKRLDAFSEAEAVVHVDGCLLVGAVDEEREKATLANDTAPTAVCQWDPTSYSLERRQSLPSRCLNGLQPSQQQQEKGKAVLVDDKGDERNDCNSNDNDVQEPQEGRRRKQREEEPPAKKGQGARSNVRLAHAAAYCAKRQRRAATAAAAAKLSPAAAAAAAGSVRELLAALGLEKHATRLEREEVDLAVLPLVSDRDLMAMGITALGPRRKVLAAAAALIASQAAGPPTPMPVALHANGVRSNATTSAAAKERCPAPLPAVSRPKPRKAKGPTVGARLAASLAAHGWEKRSGCVNKESTVQSEGREAKRGAAVDAYRFRPEEGSRLGAGTTGAAVLGSAIASVQTATDCTRGQETCTGAEPITLQDESACTRGTIARGTATGTDDGEDVQCTPQLRQSVIAMQLDAVVINRTTSNLLVESCTLGGGHIRKHALPARSMWLMAGKHSGAATRPGEVDLRDFHDSGASLPSDRREMRSASSRAACLQDAEEELLRCFADKDGRGAARLVGTNMPVRLNQEDLSDGSCSEHEVDTMVQCSQFGFQPG